MTAADLASIQEQIFGDIQGYTLSSTGRAKLQRESDPAFTYGEVTPEAVEMFMNMVQPQPGEVFYDLGSGTGKAVIFASLLAPFAKSVGVELVEDLHAASNLARERLETQIRPGLHPDYHGRQVHFVNGDMFQQDLTDGGVVFTHCTCFDDDFMARLGEKLANSLKSGARVITVTKGLTHPQFEFMGSTPFRMAWGDATVLFYRKI
jgi:SAM-dependent methyltransferase